MEELERHLLAGGELSAQQVAEAVTLLLDASISGQRKAAFLKALSVKGETPGEIARFVEEFLKHAIDPKVDETSLAGPILDVVGTGGDKLNLFNVSTTAMFVLAAGGVCIVKHGNRGVTSKSGGADVLESLGVKINLESADLTRCLQKTGLAFVFAPLYHPAFKAVVEARKLLAAEGRRSIFNLLGPLLNPARPSRQLVGVFEPQLVPAFAQILQQLGRKCAWVVHGETDDGRGMDELSTLGKNQVAKVSPEAITHAEFHPASLGFASPALSDLAGGEADANADILEGILAGRHKGAKRDLVVLNAAAGFVVAGKAPDLAAGKLLAEEILDRGSTHVKLRALQDWC